MVYFRGVEQLIYASKTLPSQKEFFRGRSSFGFAAETAEPRNPCHGT